MNRRSFLSYPVAMICATAAAAKDYRTDQIAVSPFLAVLDGECRRHALDRTADFSVLPSQLAAARERADY